MTQWETRITKALATDKTWNLEEDGNKWGKQGWRIVNVLIRGTGDQTAIYVVYQRPIEPEKPKAPSLDI